VLRLNEEILPAEFVWTLPTSVPFNEVQATTQNNKMHLILNTTKDNLKSAPGFKYDSKTTTWMPEPAKNK
jgi:hypothetical protein